MKVEETCFRNIVALKVIRSIIKYQINTCRFIRVFVTLIDLSDFRLLKNRRTPLHCRS